MDVTMQVSGSMSWQVVLLDAARTRHAKCRLVGFQWQHKVPAPCWSESVAQTVKLI